MNTSNNGGTLYGLGVGPGDPELVTQKAVLCLRRADLVLYDALVHPDLLKHCRNDAERVFVGKRAGRPHERQASINQRLIEGARQGRVVVRLKGGDPFIFGRGGEEALALVEAGVPFRIVPGVSSGIGGLAYAGIPVTHRAVNSAVTFLTGHDVAGQVPERLDWDAIARGSPVIVVYMALRHLAGIAGRLIAEGRRRQEPAAIVARATTPAQRELDLGLCGGGRGAQNR